MSAIYDNWERLVAAVLKREEIWQLCHQPSRSPSICSESLDFSSSSFRLSDVNKLEKKEESVQIPIPKLIFPGLPLKNALKSTRELGKGRFETSILTQLQRDMKLSDREFLAKGRFETSILTQLQRDMKLSDREFLAKGTELVMKKLMIEVRVTEEEFKQRMMVFGNCRHENVGAPRAYYFSNEANGKFILYDYHSQGSVSDMLHGFTAHHSPSWGSRLKIAIGAARGIAHIHRQCGGKLAHGNIKSSNIFLNSQQYGCVSDLGLAGIVVKPRKRGALDYHASEYEFKNASQEGDVYSFGVVLLELLTGRSPMEPQGLPKYLHIVAWARSLGPDKWTSELFDRRHIRMLVDEKDMVEIVLEGEIPGGDLGMKDSAIYFEELRPLLRSHFHSMDVEMVELMQVAMSCLAMLPKNRPKMCDVVLMLENIGMRDGKPHQKQNSNHPDQKGLVWNKIPYWEDHK